MEDAATAEISRSQLWHWRTSSAASPMGAIRRGALGAIRDEELARLEREVAGPTRLADAAGLLDRLVGAEEFTEFLTLPAYEMLEPRT